MWKIKSIQVYALTSTNKDKDVEIVYYDIGGARGENKSNHIIKQHFKGLTEQQDENKVMWNSMDLVKGNTEKIST